MPRTTRAAAVLAVLLLAVTGCRTAGVKAAHVARSTPSSAAAPAAAGGSCHARPGPLPDPSCTPGVTNPAVNQADIRSTICRAGWTKTIRPPVSVTDALKRQQITAYGYTNTSPRGYEEDHLISLELGGAPSDPRNLWPEPGASPNPKDKVENALNRAVCSGRVTLATAQHAIAGDWLTAEQVLGIG